MELEAAVLRAGGGGSWGGGVEEEELEEEEEAPAASPERRRVSIGCSNTGRRISNSISDRFILELIQILRASHL